MGFVVVAPQVEEFYVLCCPDPIQHEHGGPGADTSGVKKVTCQQHRVHAVFCGEGYQPGEGGTDFCVPLPGLLGSQIVFHLRIQMEVAAVDELHGTASLHRYIIR